MKIENERVGILAYRIHIENAQGELLEEAPLNQPRTMLFGTGRVLKSFEEHLLGLRSGETFEFHIKPEEAFGAYNPQLVIDVPKTAFMVKGEIKPGLLEIGRTIPMMDREGNPLDGRVVAVNGVSVTMDFNHPLAGKTLYTVGEVLNVREATYEELNPAPSGCGCGTPDSGCCGGGGHHHHHEHEHAHAHHGGGCGHCGDGDDFSGSSCNC